MSWRKCRTRTHKTDAKSWAGIITRSVLGRWKVSQLATNCSRTLRLYKWSYFEGGGTIWRWLNDDHCPFTGKQDLLDVLFGLLYAASTV